MLVICHQFFYDSFLVTDFVLLWALGVGADKSRGRLDSFGPLGRWQTLKSLRRCPAGVPTWVSGCFMILSW